MLYEASGVRRERPVDGVVAGARRASARAGPVARVAQRRRGLVEAPEPRSAAVAAQAAPSPSARRPGLGAERDQLGEVADGRDRRRLVGDADEAVRVQVVAEQERASPSGGANSRGRP